MPRGLPRGAGRRGYGGESEMKVKKALENIRCILVRRGGPAVERTAAAELSARLPSRPPAREGEASLAFAWRGPFRFSLEKSVFALFLNQYARVARLFDRESLIREYARL